MEKRISTRELAAVKRTAMNVAPIVAKKNKAKAMIEKWTEEYNVQEAALAGYESGLMAQLGLRTEQVVTKVVEPTGKLDKNGKEIKQTKYILTENVRYDSEKNEYIVTIKEEGDKEVAPVKDENDNEGAPCDCKECTYEEPVEDIPEEIAKDLDDMDAVNVTDAPVEVEQEEQEEHAQPEVTFEEQFAF